MAEAQEKVKQETQESDMAEVLETDGAVKSATNDGLIGLLMLRQAVVTRSAGTMCEETYTQARNSAVAELKRRLSGDETRCQRDDLSAEMERCHKLLDEWYGEDPATSAVDTLEDRLTRLLAELTPPLSG